MKANYDAIDILKNSHTFRDLHNVSFDLIMNMPSSVSTSAYKLWEDDLAESVSFSPGHLSVYSLAVEPTSYFYEKKKLREGEYPLPTN